MPFRMGPNVNPPERSRILGSVSANSTAFMSCKRMLCPYILEMHTLLSFISVLLGRATYIMASKISATGNIISNSVLDIDAIQIEIRLEINVVIIIVSMP